MNSNSNSNEKTKCQKIYHEIDKKLNEIEKQINNYLGACSSHKSSSSSLTKKLNQILKDLESLYKYIFDHKILNENTLEYVIEKNIIHMLTEYVLTQNIELIKHLYPFIEKFLFFSDAYFRSLDISLEILLMNYSIINSVKSLIHGFLNLLYKHKDLDENLIDIIANFLFLLLEKIIIFQNFYTALANNEIVFMKNKKSFDSTLFELVIEIFSREYLIIKRETKAKVRRNVLLCLNLENFYLINISHIEKMLEYMIENLIYYYDNYKLFNPNKVIENFCSIKKDFASSIIKKEKITNLDLEKLNKDDLISYLKYLSLIIHCFSETKLKNFISNLIFNKFFIEFIQKDVINFNLMLGGSENNTKVNKVFEFLYFFTSHIKNKETNEIFFYFVFGFNSDINDNTANEPSEKASDDDEFNLLSDNLISINDIKNNIETLITHNDIKNTLTFNVNKNGHSFEVIIAFLIQILETNSEKYTALKINLLNVLINIVKNNSNLFLMEIVVPYYIHNLNNALSKNFDKLYDRLKLTRDKIDLIEILKNIHPKYFNLNLENWPEYFVSNLDKNYDRNIQNMNLFNPLLVWNHNKNPNNMITTDNDNTDINNNVHINNGANPFHHHSRRSISYDADMDKDKNLAYNSNNNRQSPYLDALNLDSFNSSLRLTSINTTTSFESGDRVNTFGSTYFKAENTYKEVKEVKNTEEKNETSVGFVYTEKNATVSFRVNFFDVLVKYFTGLINNKYSENLFLTKLFLEIYSLPYIGHLGDYGRCFYNIYSNITFAGKKKFLLFNISSVGVINSIISRFDEYVRFNYNKEDINKLISSKYSFRMSNNTHSSSSKTSTMFSAFKDNVTSSHNTKGFFKKNTVNSINTSINVNPDNDTKNKTADFIDNLVLVIEFYKEYISNIFLKCYFDQINSGYSHLVLIK